ncbi:MAG TPA: hypothetical protein VGR37_05560 [Longimicrobiaceae bacterium]|nr:hypothetical protein [Longimicrobiaceae bacterium]
MAIFDRSYDRDYGYRGGSTYRGGDRDLGDRMRQGWNRLTGDDNDTDRGYGYRGGAYGDTAYDRDFGNAGRGYGAGNWQRPGYNRLEGDNRDTFDRDTGWHAGRGMGTGGAWNYDRDMMDRGRYGATDMDRYDRDYKSRWQTDNGDPFGDRTSRTPMRVMRGEYHNYDRDFDRRPYGAGSNMNYDRDMVYRADADRDMDRGYMHGLNYDPYQERGDLRTGRTGWGASDRNRGYDRGWF